MRGDGMEYEHNTSAGDGCNLCQTAMLFSLLLRDSDVDPVLVDYVEQRNGDENNTSAGDGGLFPQETAYYSVAAHISGGRLMNTALWQ